SEVRLQRDAPLLCDAARSAGEGADLETSARALALRGGPDPGRLLRPGTVPRQRDDLRQRDGPLISAGPVRGAARRIDQGSAGFSHGDAPGRRCHRAHTRNRDYQSLVRMDTLALFE